MPKHRIIKGEPNAPETQRRDLSLAALPASLQPALSRARCYLQAAHAETTQRAYHQDWTAYCQWCAAQHLAPCGDGPGEPLVALYLADRAMNLAPASLTRKVFGIADGFYARDLAFDPHHPLLRHVMEGIYRIEGRPADAKIPLTYAELQEIVQGLGVGVRDLRDAALLLVGFFGAFRRSELSALHCADCVWTEEALKILIRRAKNDAKRLGQRKVIPRERDPQLCPAAALERWLKAAGLKEGPVFRGVDRLGRIGTTALTPRSISRATKSRYQQLLTRQGISEKEVQAKSHGISAHSLRSGYITRAGLQGDSLWQIRARSGHKTLEGVSRYIRIPD
ncbi:site-specific integrase [Sneathiella aquimaris]|uniref:hypothetical protein n=1 Tax=Sneathiella aquimaris TaxID=2599305 RepID=UPI00146C31C4|nr:hypothetical protein [Sneathiella aquimaris]